MKQKNLLRNSEGGLLYSNGHYSDLYGTISKTPFLGVIRTLFIYQVFLGFCLYSMDYS
jgi:hypothetical protein